MPIRPANLGEDVPLTIQYVDAGTDTPIDPDDTDATADGVADAHITIVSPGDTEVVSGVKMTRNGTGDFEHVWDTAANAPGTGEYEVRVSAEFNGETKISVDTIDIRNG